MDEVRTSINLKNLPHNPKSVQSRDKIKNEKNENIC